jgi:peptidoglycan hydrolase-like protein with peptidoglycan-binding domain
MENNNILKSFELQDELNDKIWDKVKGDDYVISPKVREKLLEIAYEFIQFLKVDIIVSDVHLTGSLANYNWSEYSDFDLHVIADFNQFPKNQLDLYKELFTLKKTIFNSDQNIKIYGYDVELYVQDENEEHTSTGVYSLINNKWLEKPKKEQFEINKTVLKKKIDQWVDKISKVLESAEEEEDLQKSKKIIDSLKDKIKQYRKIGLDKKGEMSYENLVFKYLRRSGDIEKLFGFKTKKIDKELSLNESASELRNTLDTLGYVEKNSEITSGGEISGDISKLVSDILTKFKEINPDAKVRVTAGNDDYHQNTNSQHPKGLAIDLTVDPPSARKEFISLLDEFKKTNSNFKYSDEYSKPSKRATGPHFHLQLGGGNLPLTPNEKLIDSKSKSEFLEGIKKIALSGKDFKNNLLTGTDMSYDSMVEDIQIALQFLGYSLPIWGVDGLFGPETESAVKSFQKKYSLEQTGKLSSKDLQYLYAALIYNKFEESDLSKINFEGSYNTSDMGLDPDSTPSDFLSMTKIIVDKIEGGYYNPEWHYKSQMGRSGETMFGMDRKWGSYLFKDGVGKQFWEVIDNNKNKNGWYHNFKGGNLKENLIDMVSKIMEKEYETNVNTYLTPESKDIVNNSNGLKFHFFYSCWNGKGFFRMFANKINKAVKDGIKDPTKLLNVAINSRLDHSNPIIKNSGKKIMNIFNKNSNS